MADSTGDKEFQKEIRNLLVNIKYAPATRAFQAAVRIGDIGLPDKQLTEELTNLSREISDESVRQAIVGALK